MAIRKRKHGFSYYWQEKDEHGRLRQRNAFMGPHKTLDAALIWFAGLRALAQQKHADAERLGHFWELSDLEADAAEAQQRIDAIREAIAHVESRRRKKRERQKPPPPPPMPPPEVDYPRSLEWRGADG